MSLKEKIETYAVNPFLMHFFSWEIFQHILEKSLIALILMFAFRQTQKYAYKTTIVIYMRRVYKFLLCTQLIKSVLLPIIPKAVMGKIWSGFMEFVLECIFCLTRSDFNKLAVNELVVRIFIKKMIALWLMYMLMGQLS